jgi:signal peptide peptidase SppA
MCSSAENTKVSPWDYVRRVLHLFSLTHTLRSSICNNPVDAPNTFTDKYFSREHKENVMNIVQSLDEMEREKIAESRGLKGFNKTTWKKLRTQGSFTASQAHDLGLIDYMPSLDPLTDLVDSNKDTESKTQMKQKWGKDTDMDKFSATRIISIAEYSDLMAQRKNSLVFGDDFAKDVEEMKQDFIQMAKDAIGWTTDADKDAIRREKVAILRVDGQINDKIADKTVKALRKIKKDKSIKCVVLRVNSPGGSITASERVLQECKDIPQPVICSMSNVCASGGYYIATGCDRIFCMPSTVTGSIGVFGMRVDMTNLAKKYGVKVQHVAVGPHSTTFSSFQPLTKPIQHNFTRYVDSCYDYFKSLVAESRGLSMEEVERLAQGRVWTGEQAKLVGLVDELGGLSRAVAYAERTYTSGNVEVEVWPKRITFAEMFLSDASPSTFAAFLGHLWGGAREPCNSEITKIQAANLLVSSLLESPSSSTYLNGFMMTVDENTALNCMAQDFACKHKVHITDDFPMEFWR